MKNQSKKMSLLAFMLVTGSFVYAQNPANPPAPGPMSPPPPALGGPAKPMPPRGPKDLNASLRKLTTITGKVVAYTANDRNMYDGFTLDNNGKTIAVRFPGHLGAQLMHDAQKGQTITVNGFTDTDPQGKSSFRMVSATANGSQIVDLPPAPPIVTAAPKLKNYESTINQFRKDREGRTTGVILNSKEIIELPPHVTEQLQGLLKTGEKIAVTGFEVNPPAGVVMAGNNTLINAQTIAINGQTYLVR